VPRRGLASLLLLGLLAGATLAGCDSRADPTGDEPDGSATVVETASGVVRGLEHDGVLSWRGIPYAAPPVGDLRWRPPEPAEPWSEERDARDYGPICPQEPATTMSAAPSESGRSSEDCLTVNVHRPADADTDADTDADADLPVMVWIHGGGFHHGAGSQALYNSPELVRRGVVLVTLNYRLGALGFLAHPALQEDGSRIGNFALLDQIAALQWVQDNIEEFGGDPSRVTIFGESAGGVAVNALMAAPSAEGLFARAIAQSGFGREPALAWDDAAAFGQAAVEPLAGAGVTAEDLRALDVDELMAIPTDILAGLAPMVDDVLPRSVSATFAAGDEADVPYVVGTTDSELPDARVERLGSVAGEVWSRLSTDPRAVTAAAYGSDEERDLHLGSDVLFTEPARFLARTHSDDAPAYRYRFTIAPEPVLATDGGAPHTSELVFVFDDTGRQGTPVANADALADQISDLWVDFAADGEPDGWPLAETDELLTFTLDGPVADADPWAARLDLVEQGYAAPSVK
jgi:para-nitrobenzyl esterase